MGRRPAPLATYCGVRTLAACAAALAVATCDAAPVHPQDWPQLPPALPVDPQLEQRIDRVLARMTVEQKVGQLIQADIGGVTPEDLRSYPLGCILNGADSGPRGHKLAAPSEWLALADRFYDASLAGAGPAGIPLLWGTDAVHGHNNIPGATIFPHNIGLGAAHDPDLVRRIGEITALEVRVTGLDWTFAPTVAVVRDVRWGRTYESYSEDPELVRRYAAAMVTGLQGAVGSTQFLDAAHVLATPKHFLGDGGTGGHDQGDNRASERELRDIDSAGYRAAIAAGAQTIMASFSSWQGLKMHGNHALLTEVLKGRFGFDGLLLGDWDAHAQLPGCTAASCPAAVNAGIDVLMSPRSWHELFENTVRQAQAGEISAARLEDAVRRVLRVKLRARLDGEGRPSSRPFAGHFDLVGSAEHRAVARQAVRESLVLLKNRNHLLPLSPRARVLVAGDAADSLARQSGGWTLNWQGGTFPNTAFPHGETVYAAIEHCVSAAGGVATLSPTGEFDSRPDVAVVVFGERSYAETAGDVPTLEYSPGDKHDLALLRRLRGKRVPVVALFISGRPLWVNAELNAADSFVAVWLPGLEGGGITDVLFRTAQGKVRYDFRGRLSFSWPASPRPPAVDGRPGGPSLFPRGYGLSYRDAGDLRQLPEGEPDLDARSAQGP
jgi:beta-glucosidase